MYCSSVFFTIFSESARFAFQVHCQSCQAWQTVLILVCTLLADQFYVEFKWRSDFKSDSNPCCPGGIVNRHSGPGRQMLKSCKQFLVSLPVTLHSFPKPPKPPTPFQVHVNNPTWLFETTLAVSLPLASTVPHTSRALFQLPFLAVQDCYPDFTDEESEAE